MSWEFNARNHVELKDKMRKRNASFSINSFNFKFLFPSRQWGGYMERYTRTCLGADEDKDKILCNYYFSMFGFVRENYPGIESHKKEIPSLFYLIHVFPIFHLPPLFAISILHSHSYTFYSFAVVVVAVGRECGEEWWPGIYRSEMLKIDWKKFEINLIYIFHFSFLFSNH